MAVTPRKLIDAVRSVSEEVPERTTGYREELVEVAADILLRERDHAIKATQIQQHVTDLCERLGDFAASDKA